MTAIENKSLNTYFSMIMRMQTFKVHAISVVYLDAVWANKHPFSTSSEAAIDEDSSLAKDFVYLIVLKILLKISVSLQIVFRSINVVFISPDAAKPEITLH